MSYMPTFDTSRIEILRTAALNSSINKDEYYLLFWRHMVGSNGSASYERRYAEAMYYAFDNAEIAISDGELIVGRSSNRALTESEVKEYDLLNRYAIGAGSTPWGQESHMTIDYDLLLDKGLLGVIADIDNKISKLTESSDDIRKGEFYSACRRSLEAVIRFSDRYADKAAQLSVEADLERSKELLAIAENCRNVPKNPPKTFWEAIQSVAMLTFCVGIKPLKRTSCQYQLGRPDRYLIRFYENDIVSGRITRDGARMLVDCFAISINRRVPHGLSSGYMVGGRRADGSVVSNELTKLFMSAVADNRLVYPSVGLCTCSDTPDEDIDLACSILAQGCSHPAFFNDDVIRRGLQYYGLPQEESCLYIHSTCVEITPIASSSVWVASPYHNLAQGVLDVLMAEDYDNMESLFSAYLQRIRKMIIAGRHSQVISRYERELTCDPLLSCFVNDCLERGLDIEKGGARYNWIMPSFVGLANAVDSLNAINELVYKRGELTIDEYRKLLESNFEGNENCRQYILNSIEKYGNNCDLADEYAVRISSFIVDECKKYENPHGNGNTVPSLFCWIMHDILGRNTGATPDGRCAGFPLGDGSGPAQGRERLGPTASILSSTKWDHTPFIGGIAVNLKFSKSYMSGGSLDVMKSLVKAYLERGGFELQINVTDAEILKKAQEDPESYRDLVVRIGGYSDYFVTLSKSMQSEVIMRTTHNI